MVYLDRLYTRSGDRGETGLGDGSRVRKTHPRVVALGAADELNAALGVALAGELPAVAREALAGALPLVEPLPDEAAVDRTVKSGPPSVCGAGTGSGARPAAHLVRRPSNLPVQRVAGPTVSTTR